MKKVVRLTESDLVKIVKRVIKENNSNLSQTESGVLRYLDYMNSEKDLFSYLIEYNRDNHSITVDSFLINRLQSRFGDISRSRKDFLDLIVKWVEKNLDLGLPVKKSFEKQTSYKREYLLGFDYDDDYDM